MFVSAALNSTKIIERRFIEMILFEIYGYILTSGSRTSVRKR